MSSDRQSGLLAEYLLQEQFNPRTGNWASDTKDILLRFLQDLFHQMPTGQLHFEQDEHVTEIVIRDSSTLDTSTVGKRPGLTISRSTFAFGNLTLDNLERMVPGGPVERAHSDLLSGSFSINCLSRSGIEAETIATIVMNALRYYRRELQRAGFFQIGHLIQISPESPAGSLVSGDSTEDFILVSVNFPVYYQHRWEVTPMARLFQRIRITVRAANKHSDGSLVYPSAVDAEGNPLPAQDGVVIYTWTIPSE